MTASTRTVQIGDRTLVLETGRIARQASGAVLLREGPTVLLAAVVAGPEPRPEGDFLPLTVEYREKLAAVGQVPGSFNRREGRITDHEVLVSRLVDRTIRPLFPKGFRHEVQLQVAVLSAGAGSDPAPLAVLAAGAALHLSAVPWNGPAGALRLVRLEGRTVVLPNPMEQKLAEADFVVGAGPAGLTMVEAGARILPEEAALELLLGAGDALRPFLEVVAAWRAEAGREKLPWTPPAPDEPLLESLRSSRGPALREALGRPGKEERGAAVAAARRAALAGLAGEEAGRAAAALDALERELLRRAILDEGRRPDGRGPEEIRPIWTEAGWLPGPHGSAIFTRGETQALVTATLAGSRSAQTLEGLHGLSQETFLLHYNFPPYSVGEVRPLRGPGRREIGHGALARRALLGVLPDQELFPYVVRLESEITESNGSSSMATVCGGCLALMDAGVPLSAPVAGIAMGLVAEGGKAVILSDILGDEDHLGDMDFKVCGPAAGITALQMDNKVGALAPELLARALEQARAGRRHILGEMALTLAAPRPEHPARAPRARALRIRPNAIGLLIGPRGQTIKGLQEETGAEIGVDETGLVTIYAPDSAAEQEAVKRIRAACGEVQLGRVYRATVTTVKEFGAFVRIYPHVEGLVHVSQWDERPVPDIRQAVREGQEVLVKVMGADEKGRLVLSRREALGTDPADAAN